MCVCTGIEEMKDYNLEKILSGIHYFRCHDHIELLATLHVLSNFLQQHPKVGTEKILLK